MGNGLIFRQFMSIWRIVRIPALVPVVRDWHSFLRFHFLFAALESGLLIALRNGATREELIETLEVRRMELLDALLDLGLALGELSNGHGMFRLKGKRSKVLATPQGDALAALVQGSVTYYHEAYKQLTGRMRGAPLGDDLKEIGETVARFSKIAAPVLGRFIKTLVPATGPFHILDVGCGSGLVLDSAGKINAGVSGIGIDSDEKVTRQAVKNLEQWGLTDRFSILSGDIRSSLSGEHRPFDQRQLFFPFSDN